MRVTDAQLIALAWFSKPWRHRDAKVAPNPRTCEALRLAGLIHTRGYALSSCTELTDLGWEVLEGA